MTAKVLQRMPDDLHSRIERLAKMQGVSVNELINTACEKYLKTGNFCDLESRVTELEKNVKELKEERRNNQ